MPATFDWQTVAALGIVLITVAAFVRRALRRRRSGSSCGGCGGDHREISKRKPRL